MDKYTMAGIYFDTDSSVNFQVTSFLKNRGSVKDEYCTDQGYFLSYTTFEQNKIGKDNNSVVLLDGLPWIGSTVVSAQSMAAEIHTKDQAIAVMKDIRSATPPVMICAVDQFVIFTCSHERMRPSFFNHNEETGRLGICSDPKVLQTHHGNYWKMLPNFIYILDKQSNTLSMITYYEYDLNQNVDSWDKLFDSWQHTIRMTNQFKPLYMLSSGMDSGLFTAEACQFGQPINICHIRFQKDMEDLNCMSQRLKIHSNDNINLLVFNSDKENEYPENKTIHDYCKEINYHAYNPLNSIRLIKQKIPTTKSVVIGNFADWVMDFGWNGIRTRNSSRTAGVWPTNLNLIWPLMQAESLGINTFSIYNTIYGAYGIETHDVYANLDVLQSFYRTTTRLKNSKYKSWIVDRLEQLDYPYHTNKGPWFDLIPGKDVG